MTTIIGDDNMKANNNGFLINLYVPKFRIRKGWGIFLNEFIKVRLLKHKV